MKCACMIFNEVSITKFALIVCGCGYAALHAEVHDVHRKSHEAGEAFCITGRSDHLGPGTCWMSYFCNRILLELMFFHCLKYLPNLCTKR